ncbi:MAG: hypothetical protein KGQ83_00745 [Planctomycetes bacterium]|nr:hypothetical protein [Planctomycetota bacterium]MDE1889926.1 hypothetical protein [Planctomycetota bacterium]
MRFTKFRESRFLMAVILFIVSTTGSLFAVKESYAHKRGEHYKDLAKNWQMEYEYKVIDATSREETLNKYGKDGWELALFYPTGTSSAGGNGYFILKKRSIEKKNDPGASSQAETKN